MIPNGRRDLRADWAPTQWTSYSPEGPEMLLRLACYRKRIVSSLYHSFPGKEEQRLPLALSRRAAIAVFIYAAPGFTPEPAFGDQLF